MNPPNPAPCDHKVATTEHTYWRLHALKSAFQVKTFDEVLQRLLEDYPNDISLPIPKKRGKRS